MSFIEEGIRRTEDNEQIRVASEQIFKTARTLLKELGIKEGSEQCSALRYKKTEHAAYPGDDVTIKSEPDFDDGRKFSAFVKIDIKGFGSLSVTLTDFDYRSIDNNTNNEVDLPTLDGYLGVVRDVKWELEAPKREAERLAAQTPRPQQ